MPCQITAPGQDQSLPKPILSKNTTRWKGRDIAMIGAGAVIGAVAGAAIGALFGPMGMVLGAAIGAALGGGAGGKLGMTLAKRHVSFSTEPNKILRPGQPKDDKGESKNEELDPRELNSEFSQQEPLPRFTQQEIQDLYTDGFNKKVAYYTDQGLVGDMARDGGKSQISDESGLIFRTVAKYGDPEVAREKAEALIEEYITLLAGSAFKVAIKEARAVHTKDQPATNPSGDQTQRRWITPEHLISAWNYIQKIAEAAEKKEPLPQEGLEEFRLTYERLDRAFVRVDKFSSAFNKEGKKLFSDFENINPRSIYEVGGLLFDEKNELAARLKAIEFVSSKNS